MKKTVQILLATVALGFGATAGAIPVTFQTAGPSGTYVDLDYDCAGGCSLSAVLNPNLASLSSTLSAGDTWRFDFFTLNFSGRGLGYATINAFLAFSLPTDAIGAGGEAAGLFVTGRLGTAGILAWDQPNAVQLANGTKYSVNFSNIIGADDVWSANVTAALTLHKEPVYTPPVNVPEPTALSLFGLGLLSIGFAARRRSR